ncbi:MAG: transposase [Clostridiaceae bacterium]|nr:transposase [Clostridiaceae bacterium]
MTQMWTSIPVKPGKSSGWFMWAEGAFGVIKQDYGFKQFLLRGNKKVLTELLLVAMGYNINKFHNKIQHNRTGRQLFEKLTA